MTADEKLNHQTEISMLASKIGQMIIKDPLDLPDCAFACGVALSGILEALKQRKLKLPENPGLALVIAFSSGLDTTTEVLINK